VANKSALVAVLDFLWTPGHLWGLAIKKIREYRSAGVPMLPVKVGLRRPSTIVLSLNILTIAFSFLFPLLRLTGFVYSVIALAAGAMFLLQNRAC
jgi:protoheme IX farnesyltransferase